MVPKRVGLPYPPATESLLAIHSTDNPEAAIGEMLLRHEELRHRLELLEAEVTRLATETQCGTTLDTQHVERYDGTLGVSREFVRNFASPIGQLQWSSDLKHRFRGAGDSPGDVSGVRWGSGSLIGPDLFITAGHCFDRAGGGWVRPKRKGVTISEEEIATLMRVNFNYQLNAETGDLRREDSYPVLRLLEFRRGSLDYAIVQLGRNERGEVPGEKYGALIVVASDLKTEGAMLCVIQHPNGEPKKVEAGTLLRNSNGHVYYDNIDTFGGSSGAAILSGETGEVIGIHTNGGCSAFSGANYGVSIGAIRHISSIL
ncbi:MAG TPA: serine protease [Pyrinomonadaceae bacterium]|jgi:V8-like Glu-specific endopeptidase